LVEVLDTESYRKGLGREQRETERLILRRAGIEGILLMNEVNEAASPRDNAFAIPGEKFETIFIHSE
jgi:hypothetical protein